MNEVCGDNRFEIIESAKQRLIDATNIESRPEEIAVLDSILFRMWQMGWLPGQERTCKMIPNGDTDFAATLACSVCGNVESVYAISADEFNYCPNCGAKVVE